MKIIFAIAASAVFAWALPTMDLDDVKETVLKPPYPIGEIGWVGRLSKDGPEVTIWANTLEDIDVKVKAKHPKLSIFDGSLDSFNNASHYSTVVEGDSKKLMTRQRSCNNWGQVAALAVNDGIGYLHSIGGGCSVRARQCIRTTCNYNAAIVLCNDNWGDITIPCGEIADVAQNIVQNCMWAPLQSCTPEGGCTVPVYIVSGQYFANGYNVIVGICEGFSPDGQPV